MMGLALAKVSQTTMNTLGSSKVASQAQHYANSKAELIEGMPYTELASQAKANMLVLVFMRKLLSGMKQQCLEIRISSRKRVW